MLDPQSILADTHDEIGVGQNNVDELKQRKKKNQYIATGD